MRLMAIIAVILTVLLAGCATKTEKTQATVAEQKQGGSKTDSAGNSVPATREVQDAQIGDLSGVDATEESNWMNPNNPPELKRQYQRDQGSVLLPEDVYPVKTNISSSAWLFKFRDADAFIYIFLPKTAEGSALLDINLNSLDLSQAKGYHDMLIDLKDRTLKMSYSNDGSKDGYIRYVEIKKAYQTGIMSAFALLVKDQEQYLRLRDEYRKTLNTIKPQP